jgi:hypothetical protein
VISAFQSTFHTSSERGQHRGSSGEDKYNDKDKYRDKYNKYRDKHKDKVQKIQDMCYILKSRGFRDIKYDILSSVHLSFGAQLSSSVQ